MSKKLVFNSTDADTLAASDFVGSHLYAGGTLLTATGSSLNVNMTNALSVNVDGFYDVSTNPTPDSVGFIGNTRAASPDETGQVEYVTVGAASSDNVVAANVHGLDTNSFGMLYDGTTWDRWLGTAGAAHISDGGGSITVDGTVAISGTVAVTQSTSPWTVDGTVELGAASLAALETITVLQGTSPWVVSGTVTSSDAALANTAVLATASSVTTTSGALLGSQLANRKYMWILNNGTKAFDIGASGVASGSGFPIYPGVYFDMRVGPAVSVHADAVSGTQDARILEAA